MRVFLLLTLLLCFFLSYVSAAPEVEVLTDPAEMSMTAKERKVRQRLFKEYNESETEGKKELERDIISDFGTNKNQRWETAAAFDPECEPCQFILLDIDFKFQDFKKNVMKVRKEKNLGPAAPKELTSILTGGLMDILNNQCNWHTLKLYGKLAGLDTKDVIPYCAKFLTENAAEIRRLLVIKGKGEKIMRQKLCKNGPCSKFLIKLNGKDNGYWKRLIHYPSSAKRRNSPWMRREKQGGTFLKAILEDPEIKHHPKGAYYYKVIASGPRKEGTRYVKDGDDVTFNYWMKQMFEGGVDLFDTYNHSKPFTEPVPVTGFLRGLSAALYNMVRGDNWIIYIPSEYGFGTQGFGVDYPPNTVHMAQLHLLGVGRSNPISSRDKRVKWEHHADFNLKWDFAEKKEKQGRKGGDRRRKGKIAKGKQENKENKKPKQPKQPKNPMQPKKGKKGKTPEPKKEL